jgi:hypothetical protein
LKPTLPVMEGVPGDLQAKYQKIAAEYSKVFSLLYCAYK